YYIEQTELGLLSLAFHPRNQENKLFYVYYTRTIKKKLYTVVEEFQEDNQGEISSNGILLQISQPYANHNGGQILFDDQEYLYIGLGDGGAAGDPHNNSQNLDSLLGKILRIDINKKSKDLSYSIPADNPFANSHDAKKEIWAYGLRNPWRFSIDNQTKLIYCGDVGQWKLEEIDIIKKGGNYGWNAFEGSLVYKEKHKKITHEEPIHTFGRNDGISVTGGYVYRGNNLKQLEGHYIYGDFESRNIWALLYDEKTKTVISNKILCKAPDRISSFGVDNDNEIYILGYDKGTIYRFAAN
ncbi:MAG: PQQ-dependent sugar dehydrogenase, partial [Planctomycetes bacterium]|nr:PQQ-dependent sugar dehydrogenase [Planctomycetota bacterium]